MSFLPQILNNQIPELRKINILHKNKNLFEVFLRLFQIKNVSLRPN